MNNLRHVMLDLETFGTGPNAAIVSIGAVLFDPDTGVVSQNPDERFYRVIDVATSRELGDIDPKTVIWWLQQSDAARQSLIGEPNKVELGIALADFSAWLVSNELVRKELREWRLWANDPDFDVVILNSAYQRYQMKFPLLYSSSRSMRTICELSREFDLMEGLEIVNNNPHNALEDADYQARVVVEIKQRLIARLQPVKAPDILQLDAAPVDDVPAPVDTPQVDAAN